MTRLCMRRARRKTALVVGVGALALCVVSSSAHAVFEPTAETPAPQGQPTAPSPQAAPPGANASAPRVIPGQLIVRYKDSVTACAHCLLKTRTPFKDATEDASDSLDRLHAKHRVRSARPLFRTEAEEAGLSETTLGQLRQHHTAAIERAKRRFVRRSHRALRSARAPDLSHVYLLEFADKTRVEAAAAEFAEDPHVEYAHPNYLVTAQWTPNDPYYATAGSWEQPYDDLWGLKRIQAEAAWDVSKGQGTIVAVIDTGLDRLHPDLAANVWVNPCEDVNRNGAVDPTDFNGVDDACPNAQPNGFVDDVWGWSFVHAEDGAAISATRVVWHENRGGNWDIFLRDLATGIERQITTHPAIQRNPSIDGQRIVWEDERDGNWNIYLYDLATGTERRITSDPSIQQHPVIAGNLIVWEDSRRGNWDLFLYDLATGAESPLITHTAIQRSPAISGTRIVWYDYRNGHTDIYLADRATGQERRITSDPSSQKNPAISGDLIVWEDSRHGNTEIYLYNLQTGVERRLTTDPTEQRSPAVAGNVVVWADRRAGNFDIYLYDLTTNTERIVVDHPAEQAKPAVSGKTALWVDSRNGALQVFLKDLETDAERILRSGHSFPTDQAGHGTHVAGTIAAVGDNHLGIIGVAPQATLMTVKALDDRGQGSLSDLASALRYAADNGADVINNSWGCDFCPWAPAMEEAVRYAHSLGSVLVFAAANRNIDVVFRSPQNLPETVVVSAVDPDDQRAFFSSWGLKVDVAAPGGGKDAAPPAVEPFRNILSLKSSVTDPELDGYGALVVGEQYVRQAGTSMAAPHAAGVAALVLSKRPSLTNEDLRQVLRSSADDVGSPGVDAESGRGRINAQRALAEEAVLTVQISAPRPLTDLAGLEHVDILGTATGTSFGCYTLSYGAGLLPAEWSDIVSASASRIENGLLGSWQVGALQTDFYTLRLTAQEAPCGTSGRPFETYLTVLKEDVNLLIGSPSDQHTPALSGDAVVFSDTRNGAGDIFLYDLKTQTELQLTSDPSEQRFPAIAGGKIVWTDFRNGNADVALYDRAAGTQELLTSDPSFQTNPAIFGNLVVWEDWRHGMPDIYLYDLSTKTETRLTDDPNAQMRPAISGNTVAWKDNRSGAWEVYLYDVAAKTQRRIASQTDEQTPPALAGSRVVWTDFRNGNADIYLFDLAANAERQLTSHSADQERPAIVGDTVVWVDFRNGPDRMNPDIYRYDLVAEREHAVALNFAPQEAPALDGTRIIWEDLRHGNRDLYLAHLQVSNQPPAFGPLSDQTVAAGKLLAFTVSASDPNGDPLTVQAEPLPEGARFVPLGDVSLDGILDRLDWRLLSRHLRGREPLSPQQLAAADVDENGRIDEADVRLLRQLTQGGAHQPTSRKLAPRAKYRFIWQPSAVQQGSHPVTFTVSDGALADSKTLTITVVSQDLVEVYGTVFARRFDPTGSFGSPFRVSGASVEIARYAGSPTSWDPVCATKTDSEGMYRCKVPPMRRPSDGASAYRIRASHPAYGSASAYLSELQPGSDPVQRDVTISFCFIATAAYGSSFAPELDLLRRYRDEVLSRSWLGRAAVATYYRLSPPLSKFIEDKPLFRAAVRRALRPLIWHLSNLFKYNKIRIGSVRKENSSRP